MAILKITERVKVDDAKNTLENNGWYFYGALTTAQITALTGVVTGSKVFNTTLNAEGIYNGTIWVYSGSGTPTLQQVTTAGNTTNLPIRLVSPNPSAITTIQNSNNTGSNMTIDMPGGSGLYYLPLRRDGAVADTQGQVQIRESKAPITITSSQAVNLDKSFYLVNTTTGSVTMTLPLASSAFFSGNKGLSFTFLKTNFDFNEVVIDTTAGQFINGELTKTLSKQRQKVTISTNGNQWYIVAEDRIQPFPTEQVEVNSDITSISPSSVSTLVVNRFISLTSTATNIDLAVYEYGGRRFTFKHIDPSGTNSTVLFSSNGTLFDGSIDYALSSSGEFVTIVFDGFEWLRIA